MSDFSPKDSDFENKVRSSFNQQGVRQILDTSLTSVQPGRVELAFNHSDTLTQHTGIIHAGILTTVLDNACGYAALSLAPKNADVVSIEFKVNFLAPAKGEHFVVIGTVKKPGRTITVAAGECYAVSAENKKLVAIMTGTFMTITD